MLSPEIRNVHQFPRSGAANWSPVSTRRERDNVFVCKSQRPVDQFYLILLKEKKPLHLNYYFLFTTWQKLQLDIHLLTFCHEKYDSQYALLIRWHGLIELNHFLILMNRMGCFPGILYGTAYFRGQGGHTPWRWFPDPLVVSMTTGCSVRRPYLYLIQSLIYLYCIFCNLYMQ